MISSGCEVLPEIGPAVCQILENMENFRQIDEVPVKCQAGLTS